MTRTQRIRPVQRIVDERERECAAAVAEARQKLAGAEAKHGELVRYREDYQRGFQKEAEAGDLDKLGKGGKGGKPTLADKLGKFGKGGEQDVVKGEAGEKVAKPEAEEAEEPALTKPGLDEPEADEAEVEKPAADELDAGDETPGAADDEMPEAADDETPAMIELEAA